MKAKPMRVIRSVEHGPLPFTGERAAQALRGQGYGSVAMFTIGLAAAVAETHVE